MKNTQNLLIAQIRRDSGAQFRAGGLNEAHVADMVEAIQRGDKLPPIVVFFDGALYWMGGGDHRIEAHIKAGKKKIEAEVREGTQLDAQFYGAGDNADHGLVRTPKTKRAQVMALLEKWPQLGISGIARHAKVGRPFVYQVLNDNPNLKLTADNNGGLSCNRLQDSETRIAQRGGKNYEMNVANMTFKNSESDFYSYEKVSIDHQMPFALDLEYEYKGILTHQTPWIFVDLTPDESGHWSVRVGKKGLDGPLVVTKKGVRESDVSSTLQIFAEVTPLQIESGKWSSLPVNSPESIRTSLRKTIEDVASIGKKLADAKASMPEGEFALWVEAENGCAGKIEGVQGLIDFAEAADRNAERHYYSDGYMVTQAVEALAAFGQVAEGYEDDEESQIVAA